MNVAVHALRPLLGEARSERQADIRARAELDACTRRIAGVDTLIAAERRQRPAGTGGIVFQRVEAGEERHRRIADALEIVADLRALIFEPAECGGLAEPVPADAAAFAADEPAVRPAVQIGEVGALRSGGVKARKIAVSVGLLAIGQAAAEAEQRAR